MTTRTPGQLTREFSGFVTPNRVALLPAVRFLSRRSAGPSGRRNQNVNLPSPVQTPLRPVIIIDDEPDDLFLLRRLIEKGGVKNPVITFLDSEDVRTFFAATIVMQKKLPEFAPCVLFTDLKMPKIDGFELLGWLRKQRDFDNLTIVVMSSSDLAEDVARAEKLGADHYLLKYPGPERIGELIASANGDETEPNSA